MPFDVGELLSTGTVPCIAATILCLILENWRNSESEVIQQCALDGTSLSSDVLIPRVRTLALCWTRCPTIAYKYHGSLLWIIQLATNITQTCRWIVNIFLTDAVAAEVENITWGVKSERFEIQRIWIPWKQEARSSKKNSYNREAIVQKIPEFYEILS